MKVKLHIKDYNVRVEDDYICLTDIDRKSVV